MSAMGQVVKVTINNGRAMMLVYIYVIIVTITIIQQYAFTAKYANMSFDKTLDLTGVVC